MPMQDADMPPVPNPPVREPTLSAGFAIPRLADFRPAASDSRHVVRELSASVGQGCFLDQGQA